MSTVHRIWSSEEFGFCPDGRLFVQSAVRYYADHSREVGPKARKSVIAPKARWGIVLQNVAFVLVSILVFKPKPDSVLIPAMVVMPLSVWLGWWSVIHLGKQWRIQAGLYSDHELVRTGPYKTVRHPIYVALLGMLIGTGLVVSWWPIVMLASTLFIVGMEIRIHAEDELLADRFGEAFEEYRRAVPAYIPFLR